MEELQIKEEYYKKAGKVMLGVSLAHIPLFALAAYLFRTEYSIAIGLGLFFLIPQIITYLRKPESPLSIYIFSFIIMCFSGILIHLGKGMIEMHFHVFVFIPITAIFGLYLALIIAAATIAVHHVAFYFLLPESLFNYDANFMIVVLHATFVILETGIAIYMCGKFKSFLQKEVFVETKLKSLNKGFQEEGSSLKSIAEQITEKSNKQTEFIQKTSSAAVEIQAISNKNLEQVDHSVQVINDSDEQIKSAKNVVQVSTKNNDNVKEKITEMLSALGKINQQFQDFQSFMVRISEKTTVINDIVFQTKLLSFNASVEAARAGEHGKGFSVVAEEIGGLAKNSGIAADQINSIVNQSIENFEELVSYIEKTNSSVAETTSQAVDESSKNIKQVQTVFENFEKTFDNLKDNFLQLQSSTKEQNIGIEDISKAIINIENLTKDTVETAKKNLDSSKNIENNNSLLGKFISSFSDKNEKEAA